MAIKGARISSKNLVADLITVVLLCKHWSAVGEGSLY